MEPLSDVFSLWMEVERVVAYGVTPVGEKGGGLVHLGALGLQHLIESPFRVSVKGLGESKALA
jgi:hypothetical protein